jgi:hypothetical protein
VARVRRMGPPRRFRSHAYLPGLRTSEDQDRKENKKEKTRGTRATCTAGEVTCWARQRHHQRGRQLSPVAPQSLVLLIFRSIPFRDNLLSRLGTIRGYVGAAKENSSKLGVRGVCCCVSQRSCNCITGLARGRSGQFLTNAMRRAIAGCQMNLGVFITSPWRGGNPNVNSVEEGCGS